MEGDARCGTDENEGDGAKNFGQHQDGASQRGQQKDGRVLHVFPKPDSRGGDEGKDGGPQTLKRGIDPPVVPLVLKKYSNQQEAEKGRHGYREGGEQGDKPSGEAQSGENREIDNDDTGDGLGNGIGFSDFGGGEPVAAVDQLGLENRKGRHAAGKGTGANAEIAPKDGWNGRTHHGAKLSERVGVCKWGRSARRGKMG